MTTAELIAATISNALPNVKVGALRMWSCWFGRPYDNWHAIIKAHAENSLLIIGFDEGEILRVWEPTAAMVELNTFRIQGAKRVRWEWFYYGRPKTESNVYFIDLVTRDETATAETNVDWYKPQFDIDRSLPAVELL